MIESLMTPAIEVTYFTDPLCSWGWAFEAVWRRLRYELADRISWRYVLGGMIPDWQTFNDPLHSVHRPAQMGPSWYEVRHLTGMPIDEMIWIQDPPASSYPACVAVKAAGLQGAAVEEVYLRRLREGVMLERRNIARREVLVELFAEVSVGGGGDGGRFRRDIVGDEALEAFRESATTSSPRSTSARTTAVPITPVAPVTATFTAYLPRGQAMCERAAGPRAIPLRSASVATALATARLTSRLNTLGTM